MATLRLPPDRLARLRGVLEKRAASPVDPRHTWVGSGGLGPATPDGEADLGRYADAGLIGTGGMGEVRRVRDLDRTLAMKIVRHELAHEVDLVRRFVDEARITARLHHPGIVPVHELGTLPDGRFYYTMPEVRGTQLTARVREAHAQGGMPALRRLLDALRAACDAVAHAHAEGVVHRDLKPENILVGEHGEVRVVDWGLALAVGEPLGGPVGTPGYLAPELLDGSATVADPRQDVYALGATLWALLAGRSARTGPLDEVLEATLAGPPGPPEPAGLPVPEELVKIGLRAMATDPESRFPDAGAFNDALRDWLDGARRRESALALVRAARERVPIARTLRRRAEALRANAEAALAALGPERPEADRHGPWRQLDRANRLLLDADLEELEAERLLQGTLSVDPDLPEAHAGLAERHLLQHAEAEAARDPRAGALALARMRAHVDALPATHPDRPRFDAWLAGLGRLRLRTDPPAEATIHRYEEVNRRLVPVPVRTAPTPLRLELPAGSWLVELRAPGRAPTRYPVLIPRGGAWDPGRPVPLLPAEALGPDDIYVPEGWAQVGGDPEATGSLPAARVWIDGFVVRRFPVTNAEYLRFLDDLVARGQEELALRCVPREKPGASGQPGAMLYVRNADGTFALGVDADGDAWFPDEAVMHVDWHGACAYARWEAERTGQPWRLLTELEWEKAARGVDGRAYPWGDTFDPTRACIRDSHVGRPQPAPVTAFPIDESPYGVRGMAGGVRDWCLDAFTGVAPVLPERHRLPEVDPAAPVNRIDRGGYWLGNAREARAADRHHHDPAHRTAEVGFRLARSI